MTDRTTEMLALADYFDDIEVDENGLCKWTDVANAQTHLRAELRASGGAYVEGQRDMAVAELRNCADTAYGRYIEQMKKPECLGHEAKILAGKFGHAELESHTRGGELLGEHRAFSRAATIIASLPLEAQESDGGRAVIEGDAVVIRFPLDAMQTAMDGAWSLRTIDTRYKITDINEFAKEFRNALNREDEQGTTEIHKMADRAFIDCIESGAFGIEEHEQQDI